MPRTRNSPLQDAIHHANQQIDKVDSLEGRCINPFKGRGVFAKRPFNKGDFLLEYRGELIEQTEAQRRRTVYTVEQAVFMFDFIWNGKSMCVDGSKEDGSLGWLVNDQQNHANSRIKMIEENGKPHLCLFAMEAIRGGDEIVYNYGGTDWPWRKISDQDHAPAMETNKVPQSTLKVVNQAKTGLVDYTDTDSDEDALSEPVTPRQMKAKSIFMKNGKDPVANECCYSSEDSEEESIPATNEESSDGDISDEMPLQKSKGRMSTLLRSPTSASSSRGPLSSQQSSSSSPTSLRKSHESSHGSSESPPDTEDDGDSVSILAVSKKADGSRKYNKKQYCLFCGLAVQKLARHLERHHKNETDVARAMSFNKGSKERRMHLEHIRNKGNFAHNADVLKTGKGNLVPCKQPKQDSLGQDFMQCVYCQGLFARKMLWKHARQCKFKPKEGKTKPGKSRIQSLCAFAQPTPPGATDTFWKLVSSMHQDEVTAVVKNDPCIMEFGNHLLHKAQSKGSDQSQHVRQKVRDLGRLLLKAREVTPLKTVQELLKPWNFTDTVKAVQHTVGFNSQTGKSKSPSLALKLGGVLNTMALFFKSEALIRQDLTTAKEYQSFYEISQTRWNVCVSGPATKELKEAKWNSPQHLPFTEDVKILLGYLDEKQQQHLKDLKEESSPINWKELAQVTLARVIIFNCQSEGEVSKMPLSAFTSRDKSVPHEDVNLALSELEQKLCSYFTRIEIRGKRDKKVPVLLTPEMEEALELLVNRREECGVLKENDHLFARPSALTHIRGSDCIRQYAKLCGAKNPDCLSSTKLRKHVATLSNVLNLKDTELDQLANYLSHEKNH